MPGSTYDLAGCCNYVDGLNAANLCGFTDWRMPNINELESLVNAGETSTAT